MAKFTPAFRRTLTWGLGAVGWRVTHNKPALFVAERRTPAGVLHELSISPQDVWLSDEQPLRLSALAWTYVVFEQLEQRITEALVAAGHTANVTDRRTIGVPLNGLLIPGDPPCVMGYVLSNDTDDGEQAGEFWSFYWARAKPVLDKLNSPQVLDDVSYVPPFTCRTRWATRQILWHALRGDFSMAHDIAAGVLKTAEIDLTSSVKALQTRAAERGHELLVHSDALNYTTHPIWLEFVAVREHVAKIC